MAPARRADRLSLSELQTLLFQRRRHLTERRVRRIARAERLLARVYGAGLLAEQAAPSLRPPEGRIGTVCGRFGPLLLEPLHLDEHPRLEATAEGALFGSRTWSRMPSAGRQAEEPGVRPRRRWRDVLLLTFEALALVGFVVILAGSYGQLQSLNREVREVQRMTPAPMLGPLTVTAAVAAPTLLLPGGERPSRAGQLPPVLSGTVRSAMPLAKPPTPGPRSPRRLVIPQLGVDAPVVAGDTDEDLKKGIGHRSGTANPGEKGNMVVSAHNDAYGEIFRDLHTLEPGAEVLVYTEEGAFRYVVNRVEIVLPTRVEFMDPTDYPALTMITCYPYLIDTHRVVAVADLAK